MSRVAESTGDFDAVSRVLDTSRAGESMLVHDSDGCEGETDLVYPTDAVDSTDMVQMRNDASSLVCVALPNDASESLGLPFTDDALDYPAASSHDPTYDSRSSLSFTVNRRDSFTGITDRNRAMVISRFVPVTEAICAGEYDADDFGGEFRASGHVCLLRGVPNLLSDRQDHTELDLALADEAGIPPAVVAYEILDDETSAVPPKDIAHDYVD